MNSGMRQVAFFLALIGMVYFGWAYMIKPANAALAQQKVELQKDLEKLAELEREKSKVKDLDSQMKQLEEAISFFENKLPHKSQIHQVLAQVTEIVNMHGLKPKTNKTERIIQHGGYVELPITMELEGSFMSFYQFLLELEKLDRITKIKNFKVKTIKDTPGDISTEFTMSVFFQDVNG